VRGFAGLANALAWFDANIVDWVVNFTGAVGRGAAWIGGFIDRIFVDGAVNGVATVVMTVGGRVRRIQTGKINNYAYGIAMGVIALAILSKIAL
jgi:NADH-quinone oxidoreductase subunit L